MGLSGLAKLFALARVDIALKDRAPLGACLGEGVQEFRVARPYAVFGAILLLPIVLLGHTLQRRQAVDQIESDLPSGQDACRAGEARADEDCVNARTTMMERQRERVERGQINHGYVRRAASLQPPASVCVRRKRRLGATG